MRQSVINATAGTMRAIAGSDEVQVAYQPGAAGVAGKRARLPTPTRALPAADTPDARIMRDVDAALEQAAGSVTLTELAARAPEAGASSGPVEVAAERLASDGRTSP